MASNRLEFSIPEGNANTFRSAEKYNGVGNVITVEYFWFAAFFAKINELYSTLFEIVRHRFSKVLPRYKEVIKKCTFFSIVKRISILLVPMVRGTFRRQRKLPLTANITQQLNSSTWTTKNRNRNTRQGVDVAAYTQAESSSVQSVEP